VIGPLVAATACFLKNESGCEHPFLNHSVFSPKPKEAVVCG
jgi:hypothetical protein